MGCILPHRQNKAEGVKKAHSLSQKVWHAMSCTLEHGQNKAEGVKKVHHVSFLDGMLLQIGINSGSLPSLYASPSISIAYHKI
jgi:hypothetical protein